jgi:diguanylate cyclase (GGDEF)-like protein
MTAGKMKSMLGLRSGKLTPSPLEGSGAFRLQRSESDLKHISRREWWLWLSAFFITLLAAVALVLSTIGSFFLHTEHFYELRPEQARWGAMCLLLLFNGWLVYRQWSFRRARRHLAGQESSVDAAGAEAIGGSSVDPVTGLYTRAAAEQQLGKEIARARRQNTSLSIATIHLEEFTELTQRDGLSAADQALKEFARRLKRACRGSDFAVRLANDDFLLVLPECNLGEVKLVLNRIGALEVNVSGRKVMLEYTTGWVDYQAGDLPGDLLKRASQLLHLYDSAAKESFAATLHPH